MLKIIKYIFTITQYLQRICVTGVGRNKKRKLIGSVNSTLLHLSRFKQNAAQHFKPEHNFKPDVNPLPLFQSVN